MKKFLIIGLLAISSVIAQAGSVTTVVLPNTFTNLLTSFPGSVYVRQIVISANTNAAAASLIDNYTNSLTISNPAYTNTLIYATNYITSWTNFYGVTQSTTNIALVSVNTNLVAATTINAPVRGGIAAVAGGSTYYDNFDTYFNRGIWATNTSSGIATITIIY